MEAKVRVDGLTTICHDWQAARQYAHSVLDSRGEGAAYYDYEDGDHILVTLHAGQWRERRLPGNLT